MTRQEYSPWEMDPQVRQDLAASMDAGMYTGVPEGAAVEDVVSQVGRDRLIEMMSGTTDRRSREWKNARDNLSRWRRGARHPGAASQRRLRDAATTTRRDEIRQTGRAHVKLNATVHTSSKVWGYADADLTGPDLDDFLAAREAGDDELAAQIVFDAYGMDPDMIFRIDEIGPFEITW
jgi:hypothetical protein